MANLFACQFVLLSLSLLELLLLCRRQKLRNKRIASVASRVCKNIWPEFIHLSCQLISSARTDVTRESALVKYNWSVQIVCCVWVTIERIISVDQEEEEEVWQWPYTCGQAIAITWDYQVSHTNTVVVWLTVVSRPFTCLKWLLLLLFINRIPHHLMSLSNGLVYFG